MVSTYYLVKVLQKANANKVTNHSSKSTSDECLKQRGDEYQGVTVNELSEAQVYLKKCRVCLNEGNIPIFSPSTASNVSQYLCLFGGIEISKDDKYPKHLCKSCFDTLEIAIKFRKTAKKTQILLLNETKNCQKTDIEMDSATRDTFSSPLPEELYTYNQNKEKRERDFLKYYDDISLKKDESLFKCKVCKSVIKKLSREYHLLLHRTDLEFGYICEQCGKAYKTFNQFKRHSLIHDNKLAFKCELCPYKGRSKQHVKRHNDHVHNKVYKYICSRCPKMFLNVSNFNRHLRRHEEPKFKCEICGKLFYENPKLKRHFESRHMGIKSSCECNVCGNTYSARKHLLIHQIKVHKRKKTNSRALYLRSEFQTA